MNPCLFREPFRYAYNRLTQIRRRTGIGEANEGASMTRVEVDSRRRRDMGLLQHLGGEFKTVRSEVRDIRVQVECAVGVQEFRQSRLRQAFDEDAAIFLV